LPVRDLIVFRVELWTDKMDTYSRPSAWAAGRITLESNSKRGVRGGNAMFHDIEAIPRKMIDLAENRGLRLYRHRESKVGKKGDPTL
jgi:hypothetical protein